MERLQQPYAIVQMLTYSHQVGVKDGAGGGRWHDGGQTSRFFLNECQFRSPEGEFGKVDVDAQTKEVTRLRR